MQRFENYQQFSLEEVDQLIFDLELLDMGYKFIPIVDTHEIYDFCFPIKSDEKINLDIDQISEDQIALFNIFYLNVNKPLLLTEYYTEVNAIFNYLKFSTEKLLTQERTLDEFFELANIESLLESQHQIDNRIGDLVESYIANFIAFILGVHSLGIKRFKDVYENRLAFESRIPGIYDIELKQLKYSKSKMFNRILNDVNNFIDNLPDIDRYQKRKLQLNTYTDIKVIDRINQYNFQLATKKVLCLYLSGASRNKAIFENNEFQSNLLKIDGRKFDFWRTRKQMYLLAIYGNRENGEYIQINETIKNLKTIRIIIKEILKIPSVKAMEHSIKCDSCILEGGSPQDCDWIETCTKIKSLNEEIVGRKIDFLNNYQLASNLEIFDKVLDLSKNKKYDHYIGLYKTIKQSGAKKIAIEKLEVLKELLLLQSNFKNKVPDLFTSFESFDYLREGRDDITLSLQYLPIETKLKNENYLLLREKINFFFQIPIKSQKDNLSVISEVISSFIELEKNLLEINIEHEIVRCLIYISFPLQESDEFAFSHAKKILHENVNRLNKEYQIEFYYLLGWLARRIKKFDDAKNYLEIGKKYDKSDPRFYLGLGLNEYSNLIHNKKNLNEKNLKSLKKINQYFKTALRLYKKIPAKNNYMILACYNDICFILLLITQNEESQEKALIEFKKAKYYFKKMVELQPISQWSPRYPEFYHTGAYLKYTEHTFATKLRKKNIQSYQKELLNLANEYISFACTLYAKPRYIELKKRIETMLEYIK
jgi:hypothetical protein